MGRRIIGGIVGVAVVIVGYFTTSTGYAGHNDATGTFCQEMLQQNNKIHDDSKKLETAKADWTAIAARLEQGAKDLRGIITPEVKVEVASVARTLATAMTNVATAPDDADLDAIDAAYSKALKDMAAACNTATGEKVGVDLEY